MPAATRRNGDKNETALMLDRNTMIEGSDGDSYEDHLCVQGSSEDLFVEKIVKEASRGIYTYYWTFYYAV